MESNVPSQFPTVGGKQLAEKSSGQHVAIPVLLETEPACSGALVSRKMRLYRSQHGG
jgi:hypothetical protein